MFVIDTNTILGRWVRLALAGNISYPPICKAAAYGARAFKYDVVNYKLINIRGSSRRKLVRPTQMFVMAGISGVKPRNRRSWIEQ